jgi:hypothetical protein
MNIDIDVFLTGHTLNVFISAVLLEYRTN